MLSTSVCERGCSYVAYELHYNVYLCIPSSNDSEFDSDGALLAFLVNIFEIRF